MEGWTTGKLEKHGSLSETTAFEPAPAQEGALGDSANSTCVDTRDRRDMAPRRFHTAPL